MVEKLNGQTITTTKTVEGNQVPKKSFIPKSTSLKIILGLLALGLILEILESAPQIIVTPAAIFGAVKFTKNKTKLEKIIAVTGAVVGSLIACSLFIKTPVPSTSSSISYESDDECISKLESNKNIVELAIKNSNKTMSEKNDLLTIAEREYQSIKSDYLRTGVCTTESLLQQYKQR